MASEIGFGILGIYPMDASADGLIGKLCRTGWTNKFTEVDRQNNTVYFFNANAEETLSKKSLETTDPLLEMSEQPIYLDADDCVVIFMLVDIFLPNSSLGNDDQYLEIENEGKATSSLEYGIERILAEKKEYMEDGEISEEELSEIIERYDGYLELFINAKKNNLIVSISY